MSFFIAVLLCFVLSPALVCAQEIELGGEKQSTPKQSGSMGWGSGIEVGRNARAAEEALKQNNATAAMQAAERAVGAAPRNARLWFLLGYASRLAGRYSKAEDAYKQGLRIERNNPDGLSGLAQTYRAMGRLEEAKQVYLTLLNVSPRRADDLMAAGELYLQSGNRQEGIALLTRAEALRPSSRAEVMLAVAYLKLKQPERAKKLLSEAAARDPRNPSVFRAAANFYREQHDFPAAIAVLKSSPVKSAEVLADLGYSYELNGNTRESADCYTRAAEMEPREIGLQLSAAEAELRLVETARARAYLARAARIDPEHYRLHAIRAQMARAEHRSQEAIREYQQAISRLPENGVPEGALYPIQLRLNLAEIYRDTGDEQEAREQIAAAGRLAEQMHVEGPARAEFLRVRASIRADVNDAAGAESDLKEAMQLDAKNLAVPLQYGNLLWKLKRYDEAREVYGRVLGLEPKNRYALEAMGSMARQLGESATAEHYFRQYASDYPEDYVPHLALGDMYTDAWQFEGANQEYERAYKLAPENAVVVASAANAAIQAGHFTVAAEWVGRASGPMLDDPRLMRERERVLFHQGNYRESARLGYQVLAQLENDRNASVYLAYDLYNLGRYDETLALTTRYAKKLPWEPNFPLLTGHVHKQSQLLQQAVEDYSEALARDPKLVEGYVNRGYVLNDLQNPEAALRDFHAALSLQPNDGVAHLGMAFSELQLHHGREALEESGEAEKRLGESGAIHLVRASAYREMRLLGRAEQEYLAALRYSPDSLKLKLALADTQFHARRYGEAIQTLNSSLALSPDDPEIYAQLAHAHAALHHREQALRYIAAAEKQSPDSSAVLQNSGAALLELGDQNAAMQRFVRAMEAPDANRVEARLLIARLFVRQHKYEAAKQQIALAFAESRVGEAAPVSADNFIEAANLFVAMSDFDLAHRYFDRAKQAGASDEVVAIGLANSALAEGRTEEAKAELSQLGDPAAHANSFEYKMVEANIYRQQNQPFQAMTAFARASQLSDEDYTAEYAMQQEAGEQGVQLNQRFSMNSDVLVHEIIDDVTILGLNQQIFSNPQTGAIPPPISSLETLWTNGFRGDLGRFPALSGFFQVRNSRGQISLPNELAIVSHDTWDYNMNAALNPVLKLGSATFAFNAGLQYTVRRDSEDPVDLDQNLFRQFAYLSTNALWNWLTVQGGAFHEAGPFTEQNMHSRELGARLQFTVGRPWGRTQLITAYGVRDLLFRPTIAEFYSTSASVGLQREFTDNLRVAVLGEYIRSWRVQELDYWIAQAMRPAVAAEWNFSRRWTANGEFSYSRGEGFHDYDNVQSSVFISYMKPFRRSVSDQYGPVPVEYPIRFSFGVQNATYFSFVGGSRMILRPVIRLTLF
jgi:tetratricopeptide (TPR) repeat protein